MAKANPITPFPADIDRTAFGHWLSGFADGESCFKLGAVTFKGSKLLHPNSEFSIDLRDDDSDTIRLIQSFLGCGRLFFRDNRRSKLPGANPVVRLSVSRIEDQASIIIPHFERFPLRSKKSADFTIWRQGVLMRAAVSTQRQTYTFKLNSTGTRNVFAGISPKWLPEQIDAFLALKNRLSQQRKYRNRDSEATSENEDDTLKPHPSA
jgi:hypothetical protein